MLDHGSMDSIHKKDLQKQSRISVQSRESREESGLLQKVTEVVSGY